MSDLNAKFTDLEGLLSSQHTEIVNGIDSILTALGAPPPGPTTTLADVLAAMEQLIVVCTGIRTDMADQQELLLTAVETMNSNNSLNTQRLLAALGELDPCKTCPAPPLTIPPIDTTPQTVDQEHCKRMQGLIYALERMTVKLDILSSFGMGFSTTVIRDAMNEVLTEVGVLDSGVLPSLPEAARMVAACVGFVASNVVAGDSLAAQFVLIKDSLLEPLYNATNANDGIAAYKTTVDASSIPAAVKGVFDAMAWVSLFNWYYDPSHELDTTGFDGTLCGAVDPMTCNQIDAVVDGVSIGGGSITYRYAVQWPVGYDSSTDQPNGYVHTQNVVLLGNQHGFRARKISGGPIRMFAFNGTSLVVDVQLDSIAAPNYYTITVDTTHLVIDSYGDDNAPFTVEFCPPEPG